jgi:hypothetical protein
LPLLPKAPPELALPLVALPLVALALPLPLLPKALVLSAPPRPRPAATPLVFESSSRLSMLSRSSSSSSPPAQRPGVVVWRGRGGGRQARCS